MKFTLIAVILFSTSITTLAQNSTEKVRIISSEMEPIHWGGIVTDVDYINYVNPTTFSEMTKVYATADTNSLVLDTFFFDTRLGLVRVGDIWGKVVKEVTRQDGSNYTINSQGIFMRWYEVALNNKVGYIRDSDICTQSLAGDNGDRYFVHGGDLYKYSHALRSFTDTLFNMSGMYMDPIPHQGWKNVNMLCRFTSVGAFCGGGRSDIFVIDANDSLFELITGGYVNTEDMVEIPYFKHKVYLPVTFDSGKTLLLYNGDQDNIVDQYSGEFQVFSLPAGIKVPAKEVVVRTVFTTPVLRDAKGNPLKDKNGEYLTGKKRVTEYYRWDGKRLVRI